MDVAAFVDWPSAPLTESLVRRALQLLPSPPSVVPSLSQLVDTDKPTLQWCTYDAMDHELTLSGPSTVLSSSITIRKALIRKHFLHRCIHAYATKHPESPLLQGVPRTWDIEISFADELDEMWSDDLWDLAEELDENEDKWWILKPGMADRGMGIRLFNSRETLHKIFESFEAESDEGEESEEEDTNVVMSQLRHFVIQEYLPNPVLLDPGEVNGDSGNISLISPKEALRGHKFHLRAYCVASGSLTIYLYPRVLALFSSEPYSKPTASHETSEALDMRPHLTNTCLQEDQGERNVRLLQELVGSRVCSSPEDKFTEEDATSLLRQMSEILGETFKAALQMPVHFQPLPNTFELFGVDFLVGHQTFSSTSDKFQVKLLEINSEPAIEMTGPRLRWVLEDLFELIGKTCVGPFFKDEKSDEVLLSLFDDTRELRKCLEVNLHR
ncbi:hypothetical protein M0805_004322 [Coniferiporia weirii]|nr:hypothetical protein M0805_004322 [Coniferiporia weirii]